MPDANPRVFLEIEEVGRLAFELRADVAPRTAENFRALCTGEKGTSAHSRLPLCFLGTRIHRIVPGFVAQGGDIVSDDGTGGESIYGPAGFPDEVCRHPPRHAPESPPFVVFFVSYVARRRVLTRGERSRQERPSRRARRRRRHPFPRRQRSPESRALRHDRAGVLSMANAGRGTPNQSNFFITLGRAPHLDGKHVVFGGLIVEDSGGGGASLLAKLDALGSKAGG